MAIINHPWRLGFGSKQAAVKPSGMRSWRSRQTSPMPPINGGISIFGNAPRQATQNLVQIPETLWWTPENGSRLELGFTQSQHVGFVTGQKLFELGLQGLALPGFLQMLFKTRDNFLGLDLRLTILFAQHPQFTAGWLIRNRGRHQRRLCRDGLGYRCCRWLRRIIWLCFALFLYGTPP